MRRRPDPFKGERLRVEVISEGGRGQLVVKPVHPKAMPVILREDDWETWLTADVKDALRLRQPWPDDELQVVARRLEKSDQHSD